MLIRKIERPETTTHFLEFPFHWCKDENEVSNALIGVKPEDVVSVMRSIDRESFQPLLYFAIRRDGKQIGEWMKYGAKMEHMPPGTY